MSRRRGVEAERLLSVYQLSRLVGSALASVPAHVVVRGELVNIVHGTRGHLFAALRGGGVAIRCFVHARVVASLNAMPVEGDTVDIGAKVEWYRMRGDVQLLVSSLDLVDERTRYREQVSRTHARLEAMGALTRNRQLLLPPMPGSVAVVGGAGSAGVLDLLTAIHRRAPWVGVHLYQTQLQGVGAERAIAGAIRAAAASGADVIAVVRGGGAHEDFRPFDSVDVCLAIADSALPVLTALGHEQDRRLADLVAHTSASTPTDAARHLVGDVKDVREAVRNARLRIARAIQQVHGRTVYHFTSHTGRVNGAAELLTARARARVARIGLTQRTHGLLGSSALRRTQASSHTSRSLRAASSKVQLARARTTRARDQVIRELQRILDRCALQSSAARARVDAAHPLRIVGRGFVAVTDESGSPVTDVAAARSTKMLTLQFRDGAIQVLTHRPS